MKLLYIALCDLWEDGEIGIRKKVFGQLKTLGKRYDTYMVCWKNMLFCTFHGPELSDKRVLLSFCDVYEALEDFVKREGIRLIYLRYLKTNFYMNRFLKNMKKAGVEVVIEFPSLPYDKEFEGRVELEEDRLYRHHLKRYVSQSVNYVGLTSAFGIPSVAIQNGVDLEEIPLKKERAGDDIILIAVAAMNFWHGYDRLIKGMANYYRSGGEKPKVYLKLVGSGKEIPRYRDLIRVHGLEEYVLLKGLMYGEELTEEFNTADVGVAVLGAYRKDSFRGSELKAKEYCARGIPMVIGNEDLAFTTDLDFVHQVPNDDTDIDVDDVVAFYRRWKENGDRKTIRAYARQHLTWDVIFGEVFDKGLVFPQE